MSGLLDVAKKAYHIVRGDATQVPNWSMRVHANKVTAAAFFKDGRRVVTGSDDRTLQIWDVEKGAPVGGPFERHRSDGSSVAISPDNRRIASSGVKYTIIIWDVESKQMVFGPLVKHTATVWSVSFSPDGKRLASGSGDKTIVIWDVETGVVLSTLQDPNCSSVYCIAFSPDGLKLASGSQDQTIRVWRADNAELLLRINAHNSYVRRVVWSPDGQQLVSASFDTTVKFWDSSSGTQVGQTCIGHTGYIASLEISSDGFFIATASNDMTVRLWSTNSHKQIGHELKHTSCVRSVAISPTGTLLVSGDNNGQVRLWSIENTLSEAIQLCSLSDSYFSYRSKVRLGQKFYSEALSDAEKVIELNHLSPLGYELKHAALHGAQRYDDAFEAFKILLSKLDNAPDAQVQEIGQKYINPSKVLEAAVRPTIHVQLENAPLRLISTSTGHLCNRNAQIDAFIESVEYKWLLYSSVMHGPLQMEPITEAVTKYFSWVMLSHRWERKEPLLHDIQDKIIYDLDPVGTIVKLQQFCKVARDAGFRWAWSDTCCTDQNNNVELQESVNSMFVWYHCSALTIVYLSDVSPKFGALADSVWNTRGWTIQEFLAPCIVLFYQADWTLYLDDRSPNHKKSLSIMQEMERSTGISAQALAAFRPGMRGAREKLRWASTRVTTLQEDIACSLFGIFGVHLPVIYGEKRQNALGRLLQEIIARSGDVSALDWIGKSSEFNSCLPADITSYMALPCALPSLSEDEIQASVSTLRDTVAVESALKIYHVLDNLNAPRFANCRLQLPCIAFPVTQVRRRVGTCCTYDVKADGLQDLEITTTDMLAQFSSRRPTLQTFLLIRPWNRHDLGLPDFANETESAGNWLESGPPSDDPLGLSLADTEPTHLQSHAQDLSLFVRLGQRFGALWLGQQRVDEPADSQSYMREFRLIVRLGQPFGALLLAQQRGGEYMRIASDQNIIARVRNVASVDHMLDVRTLEIL